jgi:DnaB-like helicase C terminal domain
MALRYNAIEQIREGYGRRQAVSPEPTRERKPRPPARAEVIFAKQRHAPVGTVQLQVDGNVTRFSKPARDRQRPWNGPAARGAGEGVCR